MRNRYELINDIWLIRQRYIAKFIPQNTNSIKFSNNQKIRQ